MGNGTEGLNGAHTGTLAYTGFGRQYGELFLGERLNFWRK